MAKTFGSAGGTIAGITASNPISVRMANHGFVTGNYVTIDGVTGLVPANGTWIVTRVDANTFTLDGSKGLGTPGALGTATLSATIPGFVFNLQLYDYDTKAVVGAGWTVSYYLFTDPRVDDRTPDLLASAFGLAGPFNVPNLSRYEFETRFFLQGHAIPNFDQLMLRQNTYRFLVTSFDGRTWTFSIVPNASTTYNVYLKANPDVVYPSSLITVAKVEDGFAIPGARACSALLGEGSTGNVVTADSLGQAVIFAAPVGGGADIKVPAGSGFVTASGRSPGTSLTLPDNLSITWDLYKKPTFPSDANHALAVKSTCRNDAVDGATVWLTLPSQSTVIAGPVATNRAGACVLYCRKSTPYTVHLSHPNFQMADDGSHTTNANTVEVLEVEMQSNGIIDPGPGHDVTFTITDAAGGSGFSAGRGAFRSRVWLTSDSAGQVRVGPEVGLDASGVALFENIVDGTYYLWATREQYVPILARSVVMAGSDISATIGMHYYPHNETNGDKPLLVAEYQYSTSIWYLTRDGVRSAGPMTPEGTIARVIGTAAPVTSSLWVPLVASGSFGEGEIRFDIVRPIPGDGPMNDRVQVQIPESGT